ncbi:hypothetical protein V1478_012687 [Vespula squamosa]|uniref:Uncharacterized protein n=1 Tax=Vespula squamosa TaxID=30214 RepID=A0ABD2A8N3_VESSQ
MSKEACKNHNKSNPGILLARIFCCCDHTRIFLTQVCDVFTLYPERKDLREDASLIIIKMCKAVYLI